MENATSINYKQRKWYTSHKFPLIPVYEFRKGNNDNTPQHSFSWLFIKLWTLDSFEFELAVNVDTHWGIGATAIVPYLRIVFCVPLPNNINSWVQTHLWRRPQTP